MMRLGLARGAQGKLADAMSALHTAAGLSPGDADVHLNLGNALAESGQREEALGCYQKVLALRPDHATAHFTLGNPFRHMGRLEEAEASFRQALVAAPGPVYYRCPTIRPSRCPMKMLSVRLDDKEAAALEALCDALSLSRSEVVKRALRDLAQAARRPPFGAVAHESGLVGSVRGGPRDLAVNHSRYVRRALRAQADR